MQKYEKYEKNMMPKHMDYFICDRHNGTYSIINAIQLINSVPKVPHGVFSDFEGKRTAQSWFSCSAHQSYNIVICN